VNVFVEILVYYRGAGVDKYWGIGIGWSVEFYAHQIEYEIFQSTKKARR